MFATWNNALAVPEIANDICLVLGCHLHLTVGRHDLVATDIQFVMVGIYFPICECYIFEYAFQSSG